MTQKSLSEIKDIISEHGLKVTHQRLVIYEALKEGKKHPTAEVIFENIRKANPSISLGTVYKTLEIFVEKGLINRVNTSEGNMRYDGIIKDHDHIYCTNTKEIIDFRDEELNNLISDFFKKKKISNFELKNIRLHITGDKTDPSKDVEIVEDN